MLVGVISDTHGTLPAGLEEAFRGVERIIHAGDIGGERVLVELEAMAPVVAVRGNMDMPPLDWRLPDSRLVELAGRRVFVTHNERHIDHLPDGVDVVVTGHTHRATVARREGRLYVNPGSAGRPGADGRGPTVAILDHRAEPPVARIVEL
jgi:hypothetical protein